MRKRVRARLEDLKLLLRQYRDEAVEVHVSNDVYDGTMHDLIIVLDIQLIDNLWESIQYESN